jgi:DNA-binding MarR family transcriptional regulator
MPSKSSKSLVPPASLAGVTSLIEGWETVRPELDTWPYLVLAPAAALVRELTLALGPTFADLGIKGGDYEILSLVRRGGPPFEASPTEMSQALNITTGAMTRRMDRLEAGGYLVRLPHRSDRRAIVARLTPEGVAIVDEAVEQILERLGAILEPVRSRIPDFQSIIGDILANLESQ